MRRLLRAAGLALAALVLSASPLLGARPVPSSISVADGTFGESTPAAVVLGSRAESPSPWAFAQCFQGGELVYAQYVKTPESGTYFFTLGPTPSWQGGAAECTAVLFQWRDNGGRKTLAEDTFSASP